MDFLILPAGKIPRKLTFKLKLINKKPENKVPINFKIPLAAFMPCTRGNDFA